MSKPSISIIVPIFNELENLLALADEIFSVMSKDVYPFEIIFIDDGSRDGGGELLRELAMERPYVKVLTFRTNFGQTAAFDAGFRHATGDFIVTMDGDGQNDPHDIPAMIRILESGWDCVAGWRQKRHDGLWLRVLPSKIANSMIRRLMGTQLHDLGCSLKVFKKVITDELQLYGEMHRFIGVLVEKNGARVTEYIVNHRARRAGESKYSLNRTFKVLLDLVTVWFLHSYRSKPIYVFGGIGGGLISVSFLMSFTVLWQKIMLDAKVHRNPLFTVAVFFSVVGIQFIVLGLLAELLIRTYFEAKDQRPYTISESIGFEANQRLPSQNLSALAS